jgi:ABC-type transport system substrate-binding protein
LKRVTATGANQSTYVIEGTYTPQMAGTPLADVRVREALSLAINRQEIVDFVMEGAAALPLPYGVWKYSQDIDVDYWVNWSANALRYDPERAKELLAEAGYPNGFSFPYWLVASPGTPWQIQVGEAMIGYWQEIGIEPEVRQVEWGVFSPKRREYDPATGAPKELIGTMKNSRSAGRPNTGTRILGELGDCNLYTPVDDPPGGGSAGSYQIVTDACREIYRLWYDQNEGVLLQTDPARRREMFPPAIQYAAGLWIAVPVIEGSVSYAVDPKVVGKFSVPPGSGELGNMSSIIPRAAEVAW